MLSYFSNFNVFLSSKCPSGLKIYVKQRFRCDRKEIATTSVLAVGVKNILEFDLVEAVVKAVPCRLRADS